MKRFIVDTNALLKSFFHPNKLGKKAKRFFILANKCQAEGLIPAAVALELSLLCEKQKQSMSPSALKDFTANHDGFSMVDMDIDQAVDFSFLAPLKDPFDRMIVAAARVANLPLITADERIIKSGLVETIWD